MGLSVTKFCQQAKEFHGFLSARLINQLLTISRTIKPHNFQGKASLSSFLLPDKFTELSEKNPSLLKLDTDNTA